MKKVICLLFNSSPLTLILYKDSNFWSLISSLPTVTFTKPYKEVYLYAIAYEIYVPYEFKSQGLKLWNQISKMDWCKALKE